MLRIPVNLDSFGLGVKVTQLATIEIANIGGTATRGNYSVKALAKDGRVLREARVTNWPRKSKHVLYLLAEAMIALGYCDKPL